MRVHKKALESKYVPYWGVHAFVAVMISIAFCNPYFGLWFYIGREYTQLEEKQYFDWKGFLAPLVACIILDFLT